MGWFYEIVELKSGLNVVDSLKIRPNIYAIINNNNADLLIGLKNIPTKNFYEFKIGANTTDLAGIPEKTDRIYIINDSTEKINVLMFYMYNDYFDPLIFKGSGSVTINSTGGGGGTGDFSGDITIAGHKTSLPSGTNVIGSVGLDNTATGHLTDIKGYTNNASGYLLNIKDILNNGTGSFKLVNNTQLNNIYSRLADVQSAIQNLNVSINNANSNIPNTSAEFVSLTGDGVKVFPCREINYLRNDSGGDITVYLLTETATAGDTVSAIAGDTAKYKCAITLVQGECLADVPITCYGLAVKYADGMTGAVRGLLLG